MPKLPGELMTGEKIILREWHQMPPTYGHVAKLFLGFLESEFQHKGNKQMKQEAQEALNRSPEYTSQNSNI